MFGIYIELLIISIYVFLGEVTLASAVGRASYSTTSSPQTTGTTLGHEESDTYLNTLKTKTRTEALNKLKKIVVDLEIKHRGIKHKTKNDDFHNNDTTEIKEKEDTIPANLGAPRNDSGVLWACDFESQCEDFVRRSLGNSSFNWFTKIGRTDDDQTGPDGDHTTGTGTYTYSEASEGLQGDQALLLSFPPKPARFTVNCISLWYHMYGTDIGILEVAYVNLNASLNQFLLVESGNKGNKWIRLFGEARVVKGDHFIIAVIATKGFGALGDIAVDDITVTEGPCVTSNDTRWRDWSEWQACTVSCDGGISSRRRECATGDLCTGKSIEEKRCNTEVCRVAVWVAWSDWSDCSRSCGSGEQFRTRTCEGAEDCQGERNQSQSCMLQECQAWSNWEEWSGCTSSCGVAERVRNRVCSTEDCDGETFQMEDCNMGDCIVWSAWTDWSPCSRLCGPGEQLRTRACQGGGDCPGENFQTQNCTLAVCSVVTGWNQWTPWSKCDVTCGSGAKLRDRTCPQGDCPGGAMRETDIVGCAKEACLTNQVEDVEEWSNWEGWSACSPSCGRGSKTRTRQCLASGSRCVGPDSQSKPCEGLPCPIVGEWNSWGNWSACSASCGVGTQSRDRTCRDRNCQGHKSQLQICDLPPCIGDWSNWEAWSNCSSRCIRIRYRSCPTCNCPESDSSSQGERCQGGSCPLD